MDRPLPPGVDIASASSFADQDALTEALLEIDRACLGELGREDTGPASYWAEVYPYSFCEVARLDGRPIGYVDTHLLSDEGVAKLVRGELREGDMLGALDRSGGRRVNLYIGALAVLPEWQGKGIARALLEACVRDVKSEHEIVAVYATLWNDAYWERFAPVDLARDPLGHRVVRMDAIAAL